MRKEDVKIIGSSILIKMNEKRRGQNYWVIDIDQNVFGAFDILHVLLLYFFEGNSTRFVLSKL